MAYGTIVSNIHAPLATDAQKLQESKDGSRIKVSLLLICTDPFSRSETIKTYLIEAHYWCSPNLLPYLKKGKFVTIIGAMVRYQGQTRAAQELSNHTSKDEAQAALAAAKSQYPTAGLVSVAANDGTVFYRVFSEVVDRHYVEANQLVLGADAPGTPAPADDQSAKKVAELEAQLASAKAQLNENFGPSNGPSNPQLDSMLATLVADADKMKLADLRQAVKSLPLTTPVMVEVPF